MLNNFDDLLKSLGLSSGLGQDKRPEYIIMFGCAMKLDMSDSRCDLAGSCPHYAYCSNNVHRKGFSGWKARRI